MAGIKKATEEELGKAVGKAKAVLLRSHFSKNNSPCLVSLLFNLWVCRKITTLCRCFLMRDKCMAIFYPALCIVQVMLALPLAK